MTATAPRGIRPQERGAARRRMILREAARLFRERGYHAIGVDELGAAVGITGPGIYRHFANKQALLVELFDDVTERLLEGARTIRHGAGSEADHMGALVAFHVEFALDDRTLIAVYTQEERSLPADDRTRLRRRMRLYTDEWTSVLRELRPDIDLPQARAHVLASIGLINSVANFHVTMDRSQLRAVLNTMAQAALRADLDTPGAGTIS